MRLRHRRPDGPEIHRAGQATAAAMLAAAQEDREPMRPRLPDWVRPHDDGPRDETEARYLPGMVRYSRQPTGAAEAAHWWARREAHLRNAHPECPCLDHFLDRELPQEKAQRVTVQLERLLEHAQTLGIDVHCGGCEGHCNHEVTVEEP